MAHRKRAMAALAPAALRHALEGQDHAPLRVCGGSMRPLLRDGDRVRIRRARSEEVRPGAIVAVEIDSIVVVHRIVATCGDTVLTKGLACARLDPPVLRGDVIGVVDAVEGLAGNWLRVPRTTVAAALALATAAKLGRRLRHGGTRRGAR